MSIESRLQSRLVNYLRGKGCYVIKTKPGLGTPTGCPDIIALYEGCWLALEVKASKTSKVQPLQEETIAKLSDWSFAYIVHPENHDEVIAELEAIL